MLSDLTSYLPSCSDLLHRERVNFPICVSELSIILKVLNAPPNPAALNTTVRSQAKLQAEQCAARLSTPANGPPRLGNPP